MLNLLSQTKNVFVVPVTTFIVISTLISLTIGSAWGHQRILEKKLCNEPSGRVYGTGDRFLRTGRYLCPGERINPTKGNTVKVLCFLNRKFLYFKQPTIFNAQICAPPPSEAVQCSVLNIVPCPHDYKGPDEKKNAPIVTSPYGSSIVNNRPQISWRSVAQADSYTVIVKGNGVHWQTDVKDTTVLPYPKEQEELQYGNTYTITVIANQGSKPLDYAPLVIHLLPFDEVQQVSDEVKQIDALGLPSEEAALYDLDAIYMSKFLLDESIKTLQARVVAGSSNPTLYRLLGDRYLGALLPEEAEQAYTIADQLAKSSGDTFEIQKVQSGLKLVKWLEQRQNPQNQSQLPISKNAAH
ncbi:hypothetical protein IQ276_038675 [Desmonostoc muscorum LEGE 12446]|uniref:Uncharacterized protein n=1 Tax=Desmonostoc muscorum LEGE 12446 TaxID=1828758 RepID=A0A8J7A822_DESMC|nr:hypothetical protein [Desmonostoc muscorum]MCF2152213.1 hypothetical protein [Desmonostoc muscorum LEGE 12446]